MQIKTLLVDDSPETLETLRLQYGLHHEVDVVGIAQNIREAFEFMSAAPVDFISIDVQLGPEVGFELCSLVHQYFPDVFVTICSVEDNELFRKKATQAGAHFFLPKPLCQDDIRRLVQAFWDFHNQQAVGHDKEDWIKELLSGTDLRKLFE